MPSGSGSHGGSSHGGGGSHGGSSHRSSFGGGHSSFGGGFRRGPHYTVFMGRRVYVSGKRSNVQGLFSVLMVIAIFVMFFSGAFTMVNVQNVNDYASDYEFYHAMAAHAERNPEIYIIQATADRVEYRHSIDKYRIIYHFYTKEDNTGDKVDGYTFYVYTLEEAQRIVDEGTFPLAVNQNPLTKDTDSVPMDFLGMKLEDDSEYVAAKKGKTISISVLIAGVTIFVGCIVGNFLTLKTASANGPEEESKTETTTTTTTSTPTQPTQAQPTSTAPTTWKCDYCGHKNPASTDTCKQCGASRQE